MSLKRLVITGYRSFEIGVFKDTDPKIKVIKNVIRNRIIDYLDQGLEWVLLGGNLGTEYWVSEILIELKQEYPQLSYAVIIPFQDFGSQWNDENKSKLQEMIRHADYSNSTSNKPYENPSQFKAHTNFLLEHSEGALLLYDEEFVGKTGYFLKDSRKIQEKKNYLIDMITMDDLQNYEIY